MNKDQVKKQVALLHKDLTSANKRCNKISKAVGIPQNDLLAEALNEVESLLVYIESLEV